MSDDPVVHPRHYNEHPSGVECIEIAQWFPYNLGAAVKYIWRAGLKGGEEKRLEDLEKAERYIRFEIDRVTSLEAV